MSSVQFVVDEAIVCLEMWEGLIFCSITAHHFQLFTIMKSILRCIEVVVWIFLISAALGVGRPRGRSRHRTTQPRKVCIVMRFSGSQIADPFYGLEKGILSIINQENPNWELILTQTDSHPITGLPDILVKHGHDKDIRMAKNYTIRLNPAEYWTVGQVYFHRNVYNLTDQAIDQCSSKSRWLLVTNGDNTYHKTFLNHLDGRYDIIGYDFYSRYAYIWDRPCFQIIQPNDTENLYSCRKNELRDQYTDLGANVMNLRRWRKERRKYGELLLDSTRQDGIMVDLLMASEWRYKHVRREDLDLCLFSHSPNYYSCTHFMNSNSTLWDDSEQKCLHSAADVPENWLFSTELDRCVYDKNYMDGWP